MGTGDDDDEGGTFPVLNAFDILRKSEFNPKSMDVTSVPFLSFVVRMAEEISKFAAGEDKRLNGTAGFGERI